MMRITIGRAPDNDIVYNEPSVSGHHAEITFNGEYILITDHSTNGTWINGRKLHHASCNVTRNDRVLFPGNILLDWQVIDRLLRKTIVWEYPQTVHEPTSTIHEGARSWLNDKQEEYKSQEKPRKAGSLSFGEAISNVFSHYADFSGRARRSEYWWFFLLNMILSCIPYLGFVWALVAIIPSWAVAVRRLHDIGRSGWYLLLGFIPLVGAILLIVWYCKEGEPNRNQYGEDPKRG